MTPEIPGSEKILKKDLAILVDRYCEDEGGVFLLARQSSRFVVHVYVTPGKRQNGMGALFVIG